jgi:prepilin-type N-terminal cleavage/methylation domain-containing protein
MLQNSMRKHQQGEAGFTLVELLVVIVILGVLAGIVVFAVGGISNKSVKAACNSDVASVQTAEEANFAQSNVYVAPATLVTNKLLRSVPSSTSYTITVPDLVSGAVVATPACSTL